MNSLEKKVRELEEAFHEEEISKKFKDFSEQERDEVLLTVGGLITVDRLNKATSAESIRMLIELQKSGKYRALGFDRFVDFLNHYRFALMTKSEFYERKKALENQGDPGYDFLTTTLAFPLNRIKYLGKGTIQTDGENVIIKGDAEDGEDLVIPATDTPKIIEVLYRKSDENILIQDENRRLKETLEKQKVTIQNAHDDLDRARTAKVVDIASHPHVMARVELGLAFNRMIQAAANLSAIEKDQFRDGVLEDIAAWRTDLMAAYKTDGVKTTAAPTTLVGETIEEQFSNFIDNVDLDAVADNDGDLAAQL